MKVQKKMIGPCIKPPQNANTTSGTCRLLNREGEITRDQGWVQEQQGQGQWSSKPRPKLNFFETEAKETVFSSPRAWGQSQRIPSVGDQSKLIPVYREAAAGPAVPPVGPSSWSRHEERGGDDWAATATLWSRAHYTRPGSLHDDPPMMMMMMLLP